MDTLSDLAMLAPGLCGAYDENEWAHQVKVGDEHIIKIVGYSAQGQEPPKLMIIHWTDGPNGFSVSPLGSINVPRFASMEEATAWIQKHVIENLEQYLADGTFRGTVIQPLEEPPPLDEEPTDAAEMTTDADDGP